MKYFAYGANMDPVGMARRCPGARAIGPATLPDHRVVFRKQRTWRTGVAHVEHAAGSSVWGMLWEIGEDDERALDRYEELGRGLYAKAFADVVHAGEPVRAMIYVANATDAKRPSARYLRTLLRGARAHGAPEGYIDHLRSARKRSRVG